MRFGGLDGMTVATLPQARNLFFLLSYIIARSPGLPSALCLIIPPSKIQGCPFLTILSAAGFNLKAMRFNDRGGCSDILTGLLFV